MLSYSIYVDLVPLLEPPLKPPPGPQDSLYVRLAERIEAIEGIAGIEVNISCPNVKAGGVAFGNDPDMSARVVAACREVTDKPLITKLSPNQTDIAENARRCIDAGSDAFAVINTLMGMAIDIEKRSPVIGNNQGGLSGPAIKPVALRMVWQVVQATKIPVVGIGGIISAEDALEFLIAGASAVQIGTANFINPQVTTDIIDGIEMFLAQRKIARVVDIIGTLETTTSGSLE